MVLLIRVFFHSCLKWSFPPWLHMIQHFYTVIFGGGLMRCKHNTSVSSFNSCIWLPSLFVSTYTTKVQDRHPWQKDVTVVPVLACGQQGRAGRVFAFSRHSWGWSETHYLPSETGAARGTGQCSQDAGFTGVSLTPSMLLCVQICGVDRRPSSDCVVWREGTMSVGLSGERWKLCRGT